MADSGPDPEEGAKRKPRIRAGPDLGSRQVGVGISVGFPVLTVGFALLVSAYLTGGALFWILGTVLFVLGLMAFTSGKTF